MSRFSRGFFSNPNSNNNNNNPNFQVSLKRNSFKPNFSGGVGQNRGGIASNNTSQTTTTTTIAPTTTTTTTSAIITSGKDVLLWFQGQTNWMYSIMDANGTLLTSLDTGLNFSTWNFYTTNIINDGGFSLAFYNGSDIKILFIKIDGSIIGSVDVVDNNSDYSSVDGRIIYYYYNTGSGYKIIHFDGSSIYTHNYDGATGLLYEWRYDGTTTENSFLVRVEYSDYYSWRVIKGDSDVEIYNQLKSSNIYVDSSTIYYTSSWILVSLYDNGLSEYNSFKLFDSNGSLISSTDLTSHNINLQYINPYGTNKVLIIYQQSNAEVWHIYNFDGTTLSYLEHDAISYPSIEIYTQNLYPTYHGNNMTSYDPESTIIYLYNGNYVSNTPMSTSVSYCDIITKFDGHDFNTYVYATGSTANICVNGTEYSNSYLSPYPTSDSVFNFIDNGDGKLSILGIKAGGSTFTINDIDDINNSDITEISYQPFGQWRMLMYQTGSELTTFQRYKIYDANGNFVANYDTYDFGYVNFRPYYDLLYVRSWENLFGLLSPIQVGTTSNTQNYTLNYIPANTYGGVPPTIYTLYAGLTGGETFEGNGYQYIYLSGNNGGTGSYNQLTGELDLYFGSTPSSGEPIIVAYEYAENFIFNNQNGGTFSSLPVLYSQRRYNNDGDISYSSLLESPDKIISFQHYVGYSMNILTSTSATGDIPLPDNNGNYDIDMGKNYILYIYGDPNNNDNATINLYNLSGELVKSINTNYTDYYNFCISDDRYYVSFHDSGSTYTHYLITPTNVETKTIDSAEVLINDISWYYNY